MHKQYLELKPQEFVKGGYNKQEEKDIEAYRVLMEASPTYTITGRTVEGCWFDIASWNQTGGTSITELKGRKSLDYPDIMIEPSKLKKLINAWEEKGIWSFYANICDGRPYNKKMEMLLFFIPGIADYIDEFRYVPKVPIQYEDKRTGEHYIKIEPRFFIPREMAYHVTYPCFGDEFGEDEEEVGIYRTYPKRKNKKVPPPKKIDIDFNKPISAKDLGL